MQIPERTPDGRNLSATNRIPPGFTIYPTGVSDALQANGYGAGSSLIFDANNKVKEFQLIEHWYGIGGRLVWEGADLDDYLDALLYAPLTAGVQEAGNFNKVEVAQGSGLNLFVPSAQGSGAWNLNLIEKYTKTSVLKCTPVPTAGNNGFFDYDSDANILTVNSTQTGGYNLYDFNANLFQFARRIFGRKQDGAESQLETTDVIGKLLYNTWRIKFTLTTAKTAGIKAGVIMTAAIKKNI